MIPNGGESWRRYSASLPASDIPLVYFSIWWFRTQHPQPVIGDGGSLDPRMWWAPMVCWVAMLGVMALLIRVRYRLEAMRSEVDAIRMEVSRHAG